MLAYIPVRFDLYRPLRPALRWTLQCLVGFADRTGRCFPSIRKLAAVAGISKSTASRHLAELARDGTISRQRRAGGCYAYRIDSRFLPPAAKVSHARDRAVPPTRREEYLSKKTSDSALPDYGSQWQARLSAWRKSRFWLPQFGPRPDEPGCFAPLALLQAVS
jgi:hypothetical protein